MWKYLLFLLLMPNILFAATETSTPGTNIGIGTVSPNNNLGLSAGLAVGNFTYTNTTAPSGGAIIQGNVGIGSLTPGQKLDVSGTIRATDILGVNNVTFTVCSTTAAPHWHCDYTAGATNAQTAINLAITAANALADGGHVLLTEGNFNIGNNNGPIIPLGNVWLQGSGMYGVTTLVGTSGLTTHAVIENITSVQNNIRVSDLKIDGTAMRTNPWDIRQKGIEINNGHTSSPVDVNIIVDHTYVYNIPGTAISTDNVPQQLITHNVMELDGTLSPNGPGGTGSSNSGTNGFPLSSNGIGLGVLNDSRNENWVISDNICIQVANACILSEEQVDGSTATPSFGMTITGNVDYGSYNTVRLSGTSYATVTGNYSYATVNDSYVITTDTFLDTKVFHITLGDNVSYQAGRNGINCLDPVSGAVPTGINFHHNMIYSATGNGISSGCNSINIDHNNVYASGLSGIYLTSPQQQSNINIDSNFLDSNGTLATSGNKSGITPTDISGKAIVNLNIHNNHTLNSSGSSQIYGIDFSGIAGTVTNVSIIGNDLSGNATSAINDSGGVLTVGVNYFPFGNHGLSINNFIEGSLNVQNRIGIGSTTPGSMLDIQGTVRQFGIFNVGLGTSFPGQKLDVVGTIRATSLSGQAAGTVVCMKADGSMGVCTTSITGVVCGSCT